MYNISWKGCWKYLFVFTNVGQYLKYEHTTNPKVKIQNYDSQNNIKNQMTTHKIACSLPIL